MKKEEIKAVLQKWLDEKRGEMAGYENGFSGVKSILDISESDDGWAVKFEYFHNAGENPGGTGEITNPKDQITNKSQNTNRENQKKDGGMEGTEGPEGEDIWGDVGVEGPGPKVGLKRLIISKEGDVRDAQ